jgi:16S rRNA (guanine527-N7)-methyltransferase
MMYSDGQRQAFLDEALEPLNRVLGIQVTQSQLAQLDRYALALLSANARLNLTSATHYDAIVRLHIADSLTGVRCLSGVPASGLKVIDVGTGGGSPGIPLAILRPGWDFVLVDSVGKKIQAVESMVGALGLDNVQTVCARVETLGRSMRDHFDLAVTRALAPLPVALEWCAPLVGVGGSLLLFKGESAFDELDAASPALEALGFQVSSVFKVPAAVGVGDHKTLITIAKIAETPQRFPRRVGVANARPLGGS